MSYTGVFVFGDSLVDSGNALKLAQFVNSLPLSSLPDGAPTAAAGYYMGRFTNGLNFADLISNKFLSVPTKAVFPFGFKDPVFGIPLPGTSDPTGNNLNFAYGGAQIRQGDESVPDLDDQTDAYRDAVDGHADPGALHLITMGGNDVRELVPTSGAIVSPATALSRLQKAADEMYDEIQSLIAIGVHDIAVTGIPNVGSIPKYNGLPDEASRRQAATDYSVLLDSLIQTRLNDIHAAFPSVKLDYVSLLDATPNILASLATLYGPNEVYPPNQSTRVFFDQVHPTAQVHAFLAATVLDTIGGVPAGEAAPLTAPSYALNGDIAAAGEVDQVVIALAANTSYAFELLGLSSGAGTLADSYLRVFAPGGSLLAGDDDGGFGLDAAIRFTTTQAGEYAVALSGVGSLAGSYRFQAEGAALGDDTYLVSGPATLVLERPGEGFDTVLASGSYALGAGVSIEKLAANPAIGAASVDLTGNEFDQSIVGNAGSNVLHGMDGNDRLYGLGSPDQLFGDAGDDYLDGGLGPDRMTGGAGNDTYYVDDAGDTVSEESSPGVDAGGRDSVNSWRSLTLAPFVENLRLLGTASDGTGNDLDNTLTGNAVANVLSGLAGNDTLNGAAGADRMAGGLGNDTYYVDDARDLVLELSGEGTDRVLSAISYSLRAHVENLALTGTAADGTGNWLDNAISGNAAANVLSGLAGNDTLNGGLGDDSLFGGTGNDILVGGPGFDSYYFDTALDAVRNVDRIVGFAPAEDTIVLDRSVFSAIGANGALSPSAFYSGKAAHDLDDRVIHDAGTGRLLYDADGTGPTAAILFAQLSAGIVLTNGNFIAVA